MPNNTDKHSMTRHLDMDAMLDSTSTAIEQCEMILTHLKRSERDHLDADFLRVHTVSLLQLVGDISRRPRATSKRECHNDLQFLFTGKC